VDEGSWRRGRGWALWKTLSGLAGAVADDPDGEDAALLRRAYDEIAAELTG